MDMDTGCCRVDHHRERHPQTARAPAQHRQSHARRTSHSCPVQPAVPRQSNCRPGSAADRACKPYLSANSQSETSENRSIFVRASADGQYPLTPTTARPPAVRAGVEDNRQSEVEHPDAWAHRYLADLDRGYATAVREMSTGAGGAGNERGGPPLGCPLGWG